MKLHVTDHAILRWIECVYGIDLGKIRDEITAAVLPAAKMGATQLSRDGYTIAMRRNSPSEVTVVTVMPTQSPDAGRVEGALVHGRKLRRANSDQEVAQAIRRGFTKP